jgi:hypothetical protein
MRLMKEAKRLALVALWATLVVFGGCDDGSTGNPGDAVSQSGMQLQMDIRGATDVAGMRFELNPVACSPNDPAPEGIPIIVVKDLEDILIPGGIDDLAGSPLDDGSSHVFADAFVALEPGCYDVITTPLKADGTVSEDCAPANLKAVVGSNDRGVFD